MLKPKDYRSKIIYLHRKGKMTSEIADFLGLTPAAVKYHIKYYRNQANEPEAELTVDDIAKLDVLLTKKKAEIEVAPSVHDNLKDLKEYYEHIMKDVSQATFDSVELMKNIVSKAKLLVEGGGLKVSELLQVTTIIEKSTNIFQMTGDNLGISLIDIAKSQASKYLDTDVGTNVIINILSASVDSKKDKENININSNDIEQLDDATTKH